MKLLSLDLKNIRSYDNVKFDFPDGSLLLSGDIGSGKSSILLAIEFALFGINRAHYSGDTLLSSSKSEGSVELSFELNKKTITIKRSLKRNNNTITQQNGHLIVDDLKTEATPTELKSMILQILGYPQNLLTKSKDLIYRYTVFTPQEMMKQIIFEKKEVRLGILRKIFGVDKYQQILENTMILSKEMRDKIKTLEGMIFDLKDKEEEYAKLKSEISTQTPLLEKSHQESIKNKKLVNDIEIKIKELDKINAKRILLNTNLTKVKEKIISSTNNSKSHQQEIKNLTNEITTITTKLNKITIKTLDYTTEKLEQENLNLNKKIKEYTQEQTQTKEKIHSTKLRLLEIKDELSHLKDIESSIKKIQDQFAENQLKSTKKEEIKQKISSTENVIQNHKLNIQTFKTNINNANEIKNSISNMDKCPTCLHDIEPEYQQKVIVQQQEKTSDFQIKIDSSDNVIKNLTAKLSKFNEEYDIAKQSDRNLIFLKEKLSSLQEKKKTFKLLTQKQIELQSTQKLLEANLTKLSINNPKEWENKIKENLLKIKEYNANNLLKKEKENLTLNISNKKITIDKHKNAIEKENVNLIQFSETEKKLSLELSATTNIETELNNSKKELKESQSILSQKLLEENSIKNTITSLKDTKEKLKKEIDSKKEFKRKIKTNTDYRDWLNKHFLKIIQNIEQHVLHRVYNEFNDLFTNWFSQLIGDETIIASLDEDFSPVISINGYDIAVENLSGGEKTAVALSYRLALNKIVNNIMSGILTKNILILDEPTDGFSSHQLDRMRDVLIELEIPQLILVSHESKLESYATNIIKVSKTNNKSYII